MVNLNRFLTIIFMNNKLKALTAFIMMLIIAIIDLSAPQITRLILDDAIKLGNSKFLIKLSLIYFGMSVFSSLFNILLEYIYSKMKASVSVKLKIKVLKQISKLSGEYYSNIKTGDILRIIESDMFIVENIGAEIIFSLIINIVTATTAIIFLMKMDLELLLIVLVLQCLLALRQSQIAKTISLKTSEIRQENGILSNLVQEYVSNIMNVVISKSIFNFFSRYIKKQKTLISKIIKLDMIISSNISTSRILSSLLTIAIYGYGGMKIIKGKMSLGELIAFQQYTGMLISPCMNIIKSNIKIQQSLVSINRIFNILDEPINIKNNNNGVNFKETLNGDIVFDNVSFSYTENKTLDSVNIRAEKGKITAFVGSSGCGKSTIVNLIFRLWDIDEGKILINGIDIKEYRLKYLRKNIAIVTQDLLLFDDSILNNLTIGKKNISKKYVEDICKIVDIHQFIKKLPDGINTIIGEKGVKLSGGQKQRIAIARALISDSSIIIFDEATSALDNISQKNIFRNIKKILENKTVIVIAHRLSTIKDADKIYVMDRGSVIEQGCHKELILNKSSYYDLINEKKQEVV